MPDVAPADLAAEFAAWCADGAGFDTVAVADDRAYTDWFTAGERLLERAGHGQCGGWTFSHATLDGFCGCGAPIPLLPVAEVVA